MGFDKIWIRINQFHLAMATPFRRPYVSWRVVSSIGELRGCTISGTRQHAGQAIAPIPRSSGDGPVEIQRPPSSAFPKSSARISRRIFRQYSSCGRGRSTERKSSQSQWKELSHSRELIFERKKRKKGGRRML